jgi:hypothetical protein
MKFPSLSKITSEAQTALLRFPLSLICAISGSFLAIHLVGSELNTLLFHLLLTLALGIPLFFSLDVLAEKRKFSLTQTWISRGLGIAILSAILISFPDRSFDEINKAPYIRYTVFNLAFHLVVAFIPYLNSGQLSSFWTYNKNLFIRMVTGLFYSAVICLGITLAVAAIKELFGVEFYDEIFADIIILSFGVFNTWFFLAGIPRDFDQETEADSYPKGLKIFTQFILIPLLLIYLAILYAYGTKIILTWDWPKGLVVYLIIAIAVLGIFTNLLLFPYQEDREHAWIRKFYKAFYYLLIPLVALLFLAIGIRIGEYGLTLNRYLVVLTGIWLTFISGYFILGKRNIKMVPVSLASILILASFGPWGMFGLSEKMQVNRLQNILTEGGILVDGRIQNEVAWEMTSAGNLRTEGPKNTNSLETKELNQVNSILHYLGEYHSWEGVYPWISEEICGLIENSETKNQDRTQLLVETMGLAYVPWYEANYNSDGAANESNESLFELEAGALLEISGYDRMIYFVAYPDYSSGESLESLKGNNYSISKPGSVDENLVLTWEGREITFPTAKLFADLGTRLGPGENKNLDASKLSLELEEDSLAFRLIVKKISFGKIANENRWIEAYSGYILVKEQH